MFSLTNRRCISRLLCIALLAGATGCSTSNPIHPSYDELRNRGFYIYVIPMDEVDRRGWSQTVSIWSWTRHCVGVGPDETSNPIRIRYGGKESGLTLLLGPWDLYWDHREPTLETPLDIPWALDDAAVYYVTEENGADYVHLRFLDQFEIPVQVLSDLPVNDVVQLLNQMEYIGPPLEEITNPWDCGK